MKVMSSEVTGNLGTTYETQVAAYYLSALLTGAGGQGLEGAIVQSVALQRKGHGDPLDDVIVEASRADGSTAKMQLQAKIRLKATGSDSDFGEILEACWTALRSGGFQHGRDRFGAVTQSIHHDHYEALRKLSEVARYSSDAVEFRTALEAPGQTNLTVRNSRDIVTTRLETVAGRAVSDEEVWSFFRHFLVMRIEMTGKGASQRDSAVATLVHALAPSEAARARDLFDALEVHARQMNARAGKVTAATLADLLAGRFSLRAGIAQESIEQRTARARQAAGEDLVGFRAVGGSEDAVRVPPVFFDSIEQDLGSGPIDLRCSI